MAGPLPHVSVWDRHLRFVAPLTGWASLKLSWKHNDISTLELVLDADHPRLGALSAPGARLVVEYRDMQLFSGPVRTLSGQGPSTSATVTITCEDDLRLLWRLLCWPDDTLTPTPDGQTMGREYRTATGPAETVLKRLVAANASRLNQPLTIAADRRRGARIAASMRFHTFAERLLPQVEAAGLGVTVTQHDGALLLDCHTPARRARPLSEAAGNVQDWAWTRSGPAATAVIIGGRGEGLKRLFSIAADTTRADTWGDVIETFADARNTNPGTDLLAEARTRLAEAGPKTGIKVTLSDAANLPIGPGGLNPGDTVTVDIGGHTLTETIRQIDITSTDPGDGWTLATPVVGDITDNPTAAMARIISALARGVRAIQKN